MTEVASVSCGLQVECQPPDAIEVAVTEYSMNSSSISLHFNNVSGTGNLQAVQIGHADQVIPLILQSAMSAKVTTH